MIGKALQLIKAVEFSNDNKKLLHKNPTETGLTYFGIYEKAHPNWTGWKIIKAYLELEPDLQKCSVILSNVSDLNTKVEEFINKEFWDKMKLDLVNSEHKQLELLCFAYNVGIKPAIKVLQETLGIPIDGIIGQQTINALNSFSESLFDKLFDLEEKEYYDELIEDKERFKIYKNGWHSRAEYI